MRNYINVVILSILTKNMLCFEKPVYALGLRDAVKTNATRLESELKNKSTQCAEKRNFSGNTDATLVREADETVFVKQEEVLQNQSRSDGFFEAKTFKNEPNVMPNNLAKHYVTDSRDLAGCGLAETYTHDSRSSTDVSWFFQDAQDAQDAPDTESILLNRYLSTSLADPGFRFAIEQEGKDSPPPRASATASTFSDPEINECPGCFQTAASRENDRRNISEIALDQSNKYCMVFALGFSLGFSMSYWHRKHALYKYVHFYFIVLLFFTCKIYHVKKK